MSSTSPSVIAHLWTAARTLFARMRGAIGDAAAFAGRRYLEDDERDAARTWLRTLEILVRKLVLIEAKALARPERPPALRHRVELRNLVAPKPPPRPRAGARGYSFRLWPRPPGHPARIRVLGPPVLVREVWRENARAAQAQRLNMVRFMRTPEPQRIARRIEALERVLHRPEHAARRLARRLRSAPVTAHRIAVQRPPRHSRADPHVENEVGMRVFDCVRADSS